MSQYATLGMIRDAVGLNSAASVSDTLDDGILTTCLIRASGKVDGWLDTHRTGYVGFASSSNARTAVGSNTRVYDGTGDDTLFIDDHSSIASVAVDDVVVDSTAYKAWPYNDRVKRALIFTRTAPSIYGFAQNWSEGTANVSVTGFAGINEIPAEVEQATLAVAILYWHRYQRTGEAPTVTPDGARGYVVDDPEVEGILASALAGWAAPGVWGG